MNAFVSSVPATLVAQPFRSSVSPSQLRFRPTTSFITPMRVGVPTFSSNARQEMETPRMQDMQEPEMSEMSEMPETEDSDIAAAPVHEDAKLFVGNLSWDTTDASLGAAFEPYGTVIDARVIFDRYTGKSRGFGFIEFEDPDSAQTALAGMNGILVDGRAIRVDRANRRPQRGNPRY